MESAYPEMRYAIVLWKNKPILHKRTTQIPHQIKSDGGTRIVYDINYNSIISIDTELLLIDLFENKVLAKSIKKMGSTRTFTKFYKEPGNDIISQTIAVLDSLSGSKQTPEDHFPQIDESSVEWKFEYYVYHFLEDINE